MFLMDMRTVAETELPKLCIYSEKKKRVDDSECWGCSHSRSRSHSHSQSDASIVYQIPLQFEGFMDFSLPLCQTCLDMLERGGFSVMKNRFDFTHAKEGEYSRIAPEFIEIHVTHGLSTIITNSIRRYKIQPGFDNI